MADVIDEASALEDIQREISLAFVRSNLAKAPQANGFCLWCKEPVDEHEGIPKRWCDADCRDSWEKENE